MTLSSNNKVSQADINHAIVRLKKSGDHEAANLIAGLWDNNIKRPEHIKRCWYDVSQKAQAVCSGNDGIGVVTIRAGVFGNEAVAWDVKFESYDMMAERTTELSGEVVGTLIALLNGD